jgi:amidohydrolase
MDRKSAARDRFDKAADELYRLNHWLYENPELGFHEFESSARLVALLGAHGFTVEYPAYGMETAFAARAGMHGPEVVICAEYDALPEIGHACGHNIIATAAVGAGIALAPMAEELGIRVRVLGTPAEEKYGGKVDLIAAGAFEGAAAAMMIHPTRHDLLDPEFLAVAHFDVEFFGKAAHAAMASTEGINALEAAVQAFVNISTLRQRLGPTDKVHGIITHGGDFPNIIPAHSAMSWYVRADNPDRVAQVYAMVEACCSAAAVATGCRVEISRSGHDYDNLVSNEVLADLFGGNMRLLGRPLASGSTRPPWEAGSTDMGNVSHLVPAIHPELNINPGEAMNHQQEFAAHTVTDDGERAIRDGALGMAWTIIDLAEGDRWSEL